MANTAFVGNSIKLENGARWKNIPRDYTQTVSVVVMVKGGLFRETQKDNGIGALTTKTWLKSGKLLELVESLGGGLNASVASDYFDISLSIPTESLDQLIPQLKKQILTPEFTKKVFEREKDLLLRELEAIKDDPNSLAFQYFSEATYKNHPYAMCAEGKTESVAKLGLADVEKYFANDFAATDMMIAVAGKYSDKQINALQDIFRAVPKGRAADISCETAVITETERSEATDPRIQQAKLYVAYTAPAASSPDYLYAKIISDYLGGGMSSPYFTALRKERGYAYSVDVMYPSRLCASRMVGYIGLQEKNVNDAIEVMRKLNASVAAEITDEEFEKTKNHMIGQFLLEAETNRRTAFYAAFFENLGLGFDHMTTYVDQIRNAKKEDLAKAAKIFDKPYTVFLFKPAGKNNGK